MESIGLVLEGGGMRGVYTAGVLEYFMENELYFPYVIGVSAGACNAASYLSRQPGRNRKVTIDYVNHPEYLSYKNLIRKKQLFGMDLIFNDIPTEHVPFDFDTFASTTEKFIVGTTDTYTGEPVYFQNEKAPDQLLSILRASSSLPFMAPPVRVQDKLLLDGGIADPIPIFKSERDGNHLNVVVLTRNAGYRKKRSKFSWVIKRLYKRNPKLALAINSRYERYNRTLEHIESNPEHYYVIQPSTPLAVDRIERSKERLSLLYDQGYEDAKQHHAALQKWIARPLHAGITSI
ncbi:patatin-like phospholipase family protein [Alkalihalobacillus sp. CinArs1]|uniref:patatin-like phospholipase family protein n=1 Tax=Alkalihalobacillus sp. CinArs1 TaxID=2995314 RepID=UPI0022DE0F4A|nr:patatin family protein [Alkalihalobacillus sp. CinArs1]